MNKRLEIISDFYGGTIILRNMIAPDYWQDEFFMSPVNHFHFDGKMNVDESYAYFKRMAKTCSEVTSSEVTLHESM